jgi:hypothetical protein
MMNDTSWNLVDLDKPERRTSNSLHQPTRLTGKS